MSKVAVKQSKMKITFSPLCRERVIGTLGPGESISEDVVGLKTTAREDCELWKETDGRSLDIMVS